mgnify:CR=1 FL=1
MSSWSREQLIWAYEHMRRIRAFEDKAAELFLANRIPGFVHLYAGEEAVAVGVMSVLRPDDLVASTHRGHGHCIAKDVDVKSMMAELFGRQTGTCKGKGGSMHIADLDRGMLGANGIVGGGAPLAVGAALSAQVRKTGQVVISFFGDGASNQGTLHESINLATIWKLPVVFICENNGYAEATPAEYSVSVKDVAARAAAYGIPGEIVDGLDFFAVNEAARRAVERARAGEGPTLLECKTYRYYGHFVGDATERYRTPEEEAHYHALDPLLRFRDAPVVQEQLSAQDLEHIDAQMAGEIAEAVRFAEESPWPGPEELTTDVYAGTAIERGGMA